MLYFAAALCSEVQSDLACSLNLAMIAQHCPPGRFFSLLVGAALLYLTSYTPLRRWLQRMAGLHPPPVAAQAGAAGVGGPQPPGGRPPAAPPAPGMQQKQRAFFFYSFEILHSKREII